MLCASQVKYLQNGGWKMNIQSALVSYNKLNQNSQASGFEVTGKKLFQKILIQSAKINQGFVRLLALFLFFSISFIALNWNQTAFASSANEDKNSILDQLGEWTQNLTEREDLDEREKDLRISFAHRLASQVEAKMSTESDVHESMYQILKNMAQIEQTVENKSRRTSNVIFTTQLAESLRSLIEPRENIVDFIKSYTEFSGLTEPSKLEEFAATRSYSDGKETYQAEAADYEAVANSVAEVTDDLVEEEYQMAKAENGPDQADTIDLMMQNSSNP